MEAGHENLFLKIGKLFHWPGRRPILLADVQIAASRSAAQDSRIQSSEHQIPREANPPEHVSSGARYSDLRVPSQTRDQIGATPVPTVESNLSKMSQTPMRRLG